EWHASGAKRSELAFARDTPIGAHAEWHDNGKPSKQGTYVEGELDGPWREWSVDGEPLIEGVDKRGAMTGTWKRWRGNGSGLYEGGYVDDARHGTWTFFDAADTAVASVVIGTDTRIELEEDDGVPKVIDIAVPGERSTHLEFFR